MGVVRSHKVAGSLCQNSKQSNGINQCHFQLYISHKAVNPCLTSPTSQSYYSLHSDVYLPIETSLEHSSTSDKPQKQATIKGAQATFNTNTCLSCQLMLYDGENVCYCTLCVCVCGSFFSQIQSHITNYAIRNCKVAARCCFMLSVILQLHYCSTIHTVLHYYSQRFYLCIKQILYGHLKICNQ